MVAMLLLGMPLAWRVNPGALPTPPSSRSAASPRCCVPAAVVAAVPQVLMQRFLPMMPCIDADAKALGVASIEGGAMSSPVWLMRTLTDPSDSFDVRKKAAENGYLAFADRGRPLRADDEGAGPSGQTPASLLEECFTGTLEAAQYSGAEMDALAAELGGERPRIVVSLGKTESSRVAQLLVATESGRVVWLSDKGIGDAGLGLGLDGERAKLRSRPSTVLLEDVGDVRGMCVSDGAKKLYLSLGDGTLAVAELELISARPGFYDSAFCSEPRQLGTADDAAGNLACDCVSNLYVCTPNGVQVFDDEGEPFLMVETPQPATGCCFGGPTLGALFISAGDTVWRVETNARGVQPPTEALLKQIEKMVGGDDCRHDGW